MLHPPHGNPEWRQVLTPEGRPYYVHVKTNETRWEPPPPPLPQAPMAAAAAPLLPGWVEHRTAEGRVYFFNAASRESTYTRPVDPSAAPPAQPPKKKASAVARVKVPGTVWCVARSAKGKTFYYNTQTRKSHWALPPDLEGKELPALPEAPKAATPAEAPTPSNAPGAAAAEGDQQDGQQDKGREGEEAGRVSKRRRIGELAPSSDAPTSEQPPQQPPAQAEEAEAAEMDEDEAALEAEMEAEALALMAEYGIEPLASPLASPQPYDDDNDNGMDHGYDPQAEAEEQMQMEPPMPPPSGMPGAAPTGAHEGGGPDSFPDFPPPEYAQAVAQSNRERRDRQQRAAAEHETAQQQKREREFRDLMTEQKLSAFGTWANEQQKMNHDPRFLAVPAKDRKGLFDDWTKTRLDEEARERRAALADTKGNYLKLMDEAGITRKSTFADFRLRYSKDPRFKRFGKMKERQDVFMERIAELRQDRKNAKRKKKKGAGQDPKEAFTAMLKEANVTAHSSWSTMRAKLADDKRFKAFDSYDREQLFRSYLRDMDKVLRAREDEVRREQDAIRRQQDHGRRGYRREESMAQFATLLVELVRNHELPWREVRMALEADHRWQHTLALPDWEKEQLFQEHAIKLKDRIRAELHRLMDGQEDLELTATWEDAEPILEAVPAYHKLHLTDPAALYGDIAPVRLRRAREDYRSLLEETKFITHKSAELLAEEGSAHGREILQYLQTDRRYEVLDCLPEVREAILREYLDELKVRGAPLPPTAALHVQPKRH